VPHDQDSIPSPSSQRRSAGVVRSLLIGYGIAIYGVLFTRTNAVLGDASASHLALWGIGAQFAVMAARALIERLVADREIADRLLTIVELIGDGTSVLLFALSTLGGIINVANEI